MISDQHVLIVDGLLETQEVLRAVLEPRGLRVDRVSGQREHDTVKQTAPKVVVLDGDHAGHSVTWSDVPQVVIGTAARPKTALEANEQQYLQKPFQYAELIQAIDLLLENSAPVA